MTNQILNIFTKYKRVFAIVFVVLLTMLSFYFIDKRKESADEEALHPTDMKESAETFFIQEKPPTRSPSDEAYLISPLLGSRQNTSDYSWLGDKLIYSTNNGVFEAGSNASLLSRQISYIYFNNNGQAILNTQEGWLVADLNQDRLTNTRIRGSEPKINSTGNVAVSYNGSSIYLSNIQSGEEKEINLNSEITSFYWSDERNVFAVQTTANKIYLIDENLTTINEFDVEAESLLVDISPSANNIGIVKENTVSFYNIQTGTYTLVSEFNLEALLTGNWINENSFIVVETYSDNPIGRITNNMWFINTLTNEKTYLANTKPIPRRVRVDTMLKTNLSGNILPFIENTQGLWLLGLEPGVAPAYSEEGYSFQPVPYRLHAE